MVHVNHRGCLPAWTCTSDQSWLRGIVHWNPHREPAAACWAHKGPGGFLDPEVSILAQGRVCVILGPGKHAFVRMFLVVSFRGFV